MADKPAFKDLCKLNYKAQATWFSNGNWDEMSGDMGKIWDYLNLCIELEQKHAKNKGAEGNELDQFTAAVFIEKTEEEGAMTATERKAAFKEIDVDSNGKMSLIEFLIWKYKKSPEETEKAPQGANPAKMKAAEAKMEAVTQAINDLTPKLEAAKVAAEESKKAEAAAAASKEAADKAKDTADKAAAEAASKKEAADTSAANAKAAADEVKAAEEEAKAAAADLQAQEDAYHGKIAKLEKIAKDESLGAVKRGKAANEVDQLKSEDPLPLRKAKVTQKAVVKKVEKAVAKATKAQEAAEAAAAEAAAAKEEADKDAALAAEAAETAARELEEAKVAKAAAEETQAALEVAYTELEAKMAEAAEELEEAKKEAGQPKGALWFMEREMFVADESLPRSKQKFDHSKPFQTTIV